MDYSTMEAGPEMDALVAERVMGFRRSIGDIAGGWLRLDEKNRRVWSGWLDREPTFHEGEDGYTYQKPLALMGGARFAPSTDIAAAWEVVEKVALCWAVNITGALTGWYVTFGNVEQPNRTYMGYAGTVSLAICRAALAVVEAETAT